MRETFGKERGEDLPWALEVWISGWRKSLETWHAFLPMEEVCTVMTTELQLEISYTQTHVASADTELNTQNDDFQDFVVSAEFTGDRRRPARQCQKIGWTNGQTGCQATRSRPGQFCKHCWHQGLFGQHATAVWNTRATQGVMVSTLRCLTRPYMSSYMGVSINGGTPKWMIYNGKSY